MIKLMFGYAVSLLTLTVWAGTAVDYSVGKISFEGYIENAGAEAPMVLLIHDWDGLTEYEIKRADMLADLGYSVFCIDLYGKGVRPREIEDKRKCTRMLAEDRPKMRAYMAGAMEFAKGRGLNTANCVAMGYCFGGTAVLELARFGAGLKGYATFHGGLDLPEGQDYSQVSGAFLIMHSTGDGMDAFGALACGLQDAKVSSQMITYSGAPHGWTVFGGRSYREKPDRQSWNLFTEYLNEVLK